MTEWNNVYEELPPCDGMYQVANNPTLHGDIGICEYDGLGFLLSGIYRYPMYWRKIPILEKKYGKIKNE